MKPIPRISLAYLPTAVEVLPRLSDLLRGPQLLVKRDDQTGLAFGGNKTRKLEFLIADALALGAQTLITAGAVQSNHCRQTAAAAAHEGLDCILILTGEKPARASGNFLLDNLLSAEVVFGAPRDRESLLEETYRRAEAQGRRPYLIPYGGSNPIGAAGYVFALQELLEQGCRPDWIVIATSSGGTQAGLVAGARLFGFTGKILGISIAETAPEFSAKVARLAGETANWLGEPTTFVAEEILVNDDYLGGGYGVMSEREREAIYLFAQNEGLLLDPVYTGRAAAGMIDLIRKGFFRPDQTVLFWHTGGSPALFAEQYQSWF